MRIDVENVTKTVPGGAVVLQDISFAVEPGELVAIVGGSGAGKTTLIEAMAGSRPADSGVVRFDGADVAAHLAAFRSVLGYVPQDDIIHAELTLSSTLQYAARLRLPPETSKGEVSAVVGRALAALELTDRADVRVSALSGGQRKRASIAVELLTEPHVFFLDEPTSGLDPATGADLLDLLRRFADDGSTVVFTTHAVQDLVQCDRIVFLAPGGRLAFHGTLTDALQFFGVGSIAEIYQRLASEAAETWAGRFTDQRPAVDAPAGRAPVDERIPQRRRRPGGIRQFSVLTRRTFETLARNRLTMAILLGSPVMVVAMFAILFRAGAFEPALPNPTSIVMIVFWITFGAFFFGLTYGLLQVCTEHAILRREHLVGLRLGPYLLSKVAVLLPFLLVVDVLMLVVLRGLDRLPAASTTTYLSVGGTIGFEAAAALALGLLTSAAVRNPSQATLALPMLCFPAVLFSGAILPVHVMARVGAAISTVIPVRWAFEAVGHDLGVRGLLLHGHSPLGPPLIASYGDAGEQATGVYWAYLVAFTVIFLVGAWVALYRSCRRNER